MWPNLGDRRRLNHCLERQFRIGGHWESPELVGIAAIHIDADEPYVRCLKSRIGSGDKIVQASADADNEVRVLGHVTCGGISEASRSTHKHIRPVSESHAAR